MNKTAKKENYAAICDELGMCPKINFVTIERGRVGYTAGKPDEVKLLASRAQAAGYKITSSLARAAAR